MSDSSKQAGKVFKASSTFWQMQYREREHQHWNGTKGFGRWYDVWNRYTTEASAHDMWQRCEKHFHEAPQWQHRLLKVVREAGREAVVEVVFAQP